MRLGRVAPHGKVKGSFSVAEGIFWVDRGQQDSTVATE
jgi:hypothetical protein